MTLHSDRTPTGRLSDPSATDSAGLHDPARQAFLLLRTVFTVAPIVFGLDKFTNLLTGWSSRSFRAGAGSWSRRGWPGSS